MQNTRPNYLVSRAQPVVLRLLLGFTALSLGITGATGCFDAATCDRSPEANPPQRYTGGTTVGGVYQSSPWTTNYLDFPGGKRYDFVHGLGAVPAEVKVYYAFGPDPGTGGVTECGSNTCIFMPDDQVIHLRNDTCTEFWIRVLASLPDGRTSQSDGGAALPSGLDADGSPAADASEMLGDR